METEDVVRHPTVHRTAPITKDDLTQDVSSTKAGNLGVADTVHGPLMSLRYSSLHAQGCLLQTPVTLCLWASYRPQDVPGPLTGQTGGSRQ